MTRTSETNWMPDSDKSGQDRPPSGKEFDTNQKGKPMKTVIGVTVLLVLALVLSRMHPAPHEIADPSVTTGSITR